MTEEIINCDFYNDKICNLFTEYFKFKVECKNLSLSTIDSDIERECPIKRLEQENRWQRDEEKYLKECCIKAGKELEKNSFAWDGKEKNLVVQALELNKRYEILKQENKDLKDIIDDGWAENKRFREENKELKKEKLNREIDSQFIEDANDRLYFEAEKYRKTLEEIRSIIIDDNSILVDKKDYIELQCGEPIAFKLQKIFNKINEVLS